MPTNYEQEIVALYRKEYIKLQEMYNRCHRSGANGTFMKTISYRMDEVSNYIQGIEHGTIKLQPSDVYKECADITANIMSEEHEEDNESNKKKLEELIHECLNLL